MPMFVKPFDITEDNRHLHLDNINTANHLAFLFNSSFTDNPSSFVYNPNTKRIQLHTEFDLHPENSKVIAQQINWLLDFEEQFGSDNKVLFIKPYLKNIKTVTQKETDEAVFNKIFSKVNLEAYFGETLNLLLRKGVDDLLVI
jgi:hypothetical protein